ncbi:P-loop containing nucleoside triphosphate hydrolase protein [Peniophora sp. CONT]|nr:P-loop containing nucleoside triphosphate hydrolase protein [Peniophora sp. CONT]
MPGATLTEREEPLLSVKNVKCVTNDGNAIFQSASFELHEGDIAVLRARSGVGKSTLVKCLAHLGLYSGEVLTAKSIGVPRFRTLVTYIPQRPSMLPGTPREFVQELAGLKARSGGAPYDYVFERILRVAREWDVDDALWDRPWNTVSGGEAQRIALAIGFGWNTAEVLLLDEPTSALDAETSAIVEETLVNEVRNPESSLKAIIWITHSDEQAMRVGTRYLRLTPRAVEEESSFSPSRASSSIGTSRSPSISSQQKLFNHESRSQTGHLNV